MSKQILIIEDDTFLQSLVARKLQAEKYSVDVAGDSSIAFKILDEKTPDMILLDLLLPRVDGFEILKKLKEDKKTKTIPVIVFSNLTEEKDIKKARDAGANEYMIKSNFTLDELVEKIKKLVK